ncbi:unnamed protein product [Arctia plantaginis]|uniref:Chemosensory protein n=1 Tax=Arctia plantaginis TaxID=874455 RepID=A0A8S0ZPA2_ARCPL|nr:unnamed protein product [Arctia plantaginis]
MFLLAYCAIQTNMAETSTYTTKYDGIELKEILSNDRILTNYVRCLLDEGPCTPDGKELKKNLPDAIANDCEKCTERQRTGADEVMHYLIDNRTDDWLKLEEKYNSDGSYKINYLKGKQNAEDKTNVSTSSENKNSTLEH